FYYFSIRPPPTSPHFPYTTLFRSELHFRRRRVEARIQGNTGDEGRNRRAERDLLAEQGPLRAQREHDQAGDDRQPDDYAENRQVDRKSTRLNSSHVKISYAVFCLK